MAQYQCKLFPLLLLLAFVAINQGNKDQEMKLPSKPLPRSSIGSQLDGNDPNVKSPTGFCRNAGERFPDTEDCSRYYICYASYEDPEVYGCPAGTSYNPYSQVCDSNYLCPVIPAVCTEYGMFPHPQDCASYYICQNSGVAPQIRWCVPPYLFNPNTQLCDYWQNVDCKGRPGCVDTGMFFPDVYDCRNYYYCTSDLVPWKYSCNVNESWDVGTQQCVSTCEATCAVP